MECLKCNIVTTPAGNGVIVLGGINGYDGEQQFLYQMTCCYVDGCVWDKMRIDYDTFTGFYQIH